MPHIQLPEGLPGITSAFAVRPEWPSRCVSSRKCLLSRYFGLRSFSVLYGLTWTFYAVAGAIGPVLMGKAFDLTGSYEALLVRLSIGTFAVGSLMLFLPRYRAIPFPSTHT